MATATAQLHVFYKSLKDAGVSVDMDAQVIRGVSVITRGEAKGHGQWADMEFLRQVLEQGKAAQKGIECRFKHPMFDDKLGTHIGRFVNFRMDDGRVRADLKVSPLADKSPTHPGLGSYVLGLAQDEPDIFGASIAFELDDIAMQGFLAANMEGEEFQSPDPLNTKNLPHARLKTLKACDIVGDPAANPDGLLQEKQMIEQFKEEVLQEEEEEKELPEEELQGDTEDQPEEEDMASKVASLQSGLAALQEQLNGVIAKLQDEDKEEELPENAPEELDAQPVAPQVGLSAQEAGDFLALQVGLGKVHPAQVEGFSVALQSASAQGAVALMDSIRASASSEMFSESAQANQAKQDGESEVPTAPQGEQAWAAEWDGMTTSQRKAFRNKEAYLQVREREQSGFFIDG